MLDKRLQLGGLQVGGPRTGQNKARFRKANNVYQTQDGYFVPRSDVADYQNLNGLTNEVRGLFRYKSDVFALGWDGSKYQPFCNSALVPGPDLPADAGSLTVQAEEKLGNLYLHFPNYGLYKYDGFNCYRAGTPLPFFTCAEGVSTGACYVRVLQHHIDQNGNAVHSGYVEIKATPSSGNITVRNDKAAGEIIGTIPAAFNFVTYPKYRYEDPVAKANGYNSYFYKYVSHTASTSDKEIVVTTGGDHSVKEGAYIIVSIFYSSKITNNMGFTFRALAHRVKAVTGTTVTLDMVDSRFLKDTGEWVTADYVLPSTWEGSSGITGSKGGANYWQSVWTSDSSTGVYFFRAFIPCFYESANTSDHTVYVGAAPYNVSAGDTYALTAENSPFNTAEVLTEFYDPTSVKQVFPLNSEYLPISYSSYQDLAVIAYSNEIYISDTSEGGSFEMTEGSAFVTVGDNDDGDVQAVCGNSDFMVVSRKYRNYHVTGNLPTANYRVTEIEETSLGAYSNECLKSIQGLIFLFNKQGVWSISQGGACSETSENIKGLFDSFSGISSFEEESMFDIDSYPVYASSSVSNQFLKVRSDEVRGFLAFVIRDSGGLGRALVLNMNNGEFYTWSDFNYQQSSPNFHDLFFINGSYYATRNGDFGGIAVCKIDKESKGSYGYIANVSNPPELACTWFTSGEPSLEKKLNQLKIFGLLHGITTQISYCKDWDTSSPVVCDSYTNGVAAKYSHKIRLIPTNFLAVSVSLKIVNATVVSNPVLIEGFELEFQPLQETMKR
jgi:hypothetical protein